MWLSIHVGGIYVASREMATIYVAGIYVPSRHVASICVAGHRPTATGQRPLPRGHTYVGSCSF